MAEECSYFKLLLTTDRSILFRFQGRVQEMNSVLNEYDRNLNIFSNVTSGSQIFAPKLTQIRPWTTV